MAVLPSGKLFTGGVEDLFGGSRVIAAGASTKAAAPALRRMVPVRVTVVPASSLDSVMGAARQVQPRSLIALDAADDVMREAIQARSTLANGVTRPLTGLRRSTIDDALAKAAQRSQVTKTVGDSLRGQTAYMRKELAKSRLGVTRGVVNTQHGADEVLDGLKKISETRPRSFGDIRNMADDLAKLAAKDPNHLPTRNALRWLQQQFDMGIQRLEKVDQELAQSRREFGKKIDRNRREARERLRQLDRAASQDRGEQRMSDELAAAARAEAQAQADVIAALRKARANGSNR